MKSKSTTLFLLLVYSGVILAQATDKNQTLLSKFSVKLSYSNNTSKQIIPIYNSQSFVLGEQNYDKNSQYGVDVMYRINNVISTGLYLGYSKGTYVKNKVELSNSNTMTSVIDCFGNSFFYGIKSEVNILPLFLKDREIRLNLYCPIQMGLVSQRVTTVDINSKKWDNPAYEIGVGMGLSYNFIRNIGVFGEYQLGKFYNDRKTQWKVGVLVTL